MLDDATRDTFASCSAKTYRVELEEGHTVELELIEAADVGSRRKSGRQPFSVLFKGPPEPLLPQRTYRLRNDELGELELFLVPVGADAEAVDYEAIFT